MQSPANVIESSDQLSFEMSARSFTESSKRFHVELSQFPVYDAHNGSAEMPFENTTEYGNQSETQPIDLSLAHLNGTLSSALLFRQNNARQLSDLGVLKSEPALIKNVEPDSACEIPAQPSSQWLIEQYELQHSMQNATKNYVCAPLQSMEAQYVEQLRKMSQRESVLKEVETAQTNRFDVSGQLKLNDEESSSLEELVKSFRTRKLQRVAALRKNQTVCEESLRSQSRYILRWLKCYLATKLQDTFAEVSFALKQFRLYAN